MKSNPNLRKNYFNKINSKEKAYWLGFLYAEGYIETRNNLPFRLGIEISVDDEILLDRFIRMIGLKLSKKYYRTRDNTVGFKFADQLFISNLVKYGCVPRKSNIIELPKLENRELYLAFLLGFFDGDGKQGTSRIVTGSKKFLKQIKEKFNLNNKIYLKISRGTFIRGKEIKGKGYSMSLGAELFNEMLDNYEYSLLRKRVRFCLEEERIKRIREKAWRGGKEKKFIIEAGELEKMVWEMPISEIAKKYGVSDSIISKRCKQWDIKKPPRGYWVKIRSRNN